jgi:hypothetical protein
MIKHASMFSQLLSIFSRSQFIRMVKSRGSDYCTNGFSNWDHFVSMLFCHLAQAKSLREICKGLKCCLGKLNHLGLSKGPSKSSLSYANKHRPWELYQDIFYETLSRVRSAVPGKKFKFKNKLLSLDASIIDLSLRLFPWASYRRTKGAVKLHLLLDHDGYLPEYAHITEGRVHEINVARKLNLAPNSVIAMDRGYMDYELFSDWTQRKIWFVTRFKSNSRYKVVYQTPIDSLPETIMADQSIQFSIKSSKEKCQHILRRVVVLDPQSGEEIELFTNNMEFDPQTVGEIYKERWQIESFFKILKQNLKVKTFIGTSMNAIQIQIWTALIAILLLKYLKFRSTLNWSFSNLMALLRWNLMTYRNLWMWLNDPFNTPPDNSKEKLTLLPFPDWDSIKVYNKKGGQNR